MVPPQLRYGDDPGKDCAEPLRVNEVEIAQAGLREVEKGPIVMQEEGALVHVILIELRVILEYGTPEVIWRSKRVKVERQLNNTDSNVREKKRKSMEVHTVLILYCTHMRARTYECNEHNACIGKGGMPLFAHTKVSLLRMGTRLSLR